MRIQRERIPSISKEIVQALMDGDLIEVEPEFVEEVELDVASVLKEYRRTDHELTERARDLVALRNLDYSYTHKIKAKLAREKGIGLGEEGVEWITAQMLELLLISNNVAEVFGDDNELRAAIGPILKRELVTDGSLDREVKRRIKNLSEGTSEYEIEYQRKLEQLRRSKLQR